MSDTTKAIDVGVRDEGTIFLFTPHTQAAKDWIEENVESEAPRFCGALVVEHRYAGELAAGMQQAGLEVRV